VRPLVGISGCLLGEETRFEDRDRHHFLAQELGAYVDWVPYSAEVEMGLGALWETWRLTGGGRLLDRDHGHPASALPTPGGLDGYVVKAEPAGVLHQSGNHGFAQFARRLSRAFPLLPVATERMLDHAGPRERFVERVFAGARLRTLFAEGWRPGDLVRFHTRHKLQILAHDPARYERAGRVVADAGRRPSGETEAEYRRLFVEALAGDTTRGRNATVMHRAFRKISKRIDDSARHDMLGLITAYERGELPVSVPIALLERHASDERLAWAAEQTYLNPFPRDLRCDGAQ
jgi:uncharacterized protein YbgA (DUF1722 family)